MIIKAGISIQISSREYESRTFTIEIPDEIIETYARHNLDLMTRDEAVDFVAENPPKHKEEDEP